MSEKPRVFNYQDYIQALEEIERLQQKVYNLEIRCRIAESDKQASGHERDCEHCAHHKSDGCEVWDCEYDRRGDDLISRQDAIDAVNKRLQDPADFGNREYRSGLYESKDIIEALPSAEKTGKWVVKQSGHNFMCAQWYECNQCGGAGDIQDNYCKHCGARMGGDTE